MKHFFPFILAFLLANKQKSPLFPNFRICRFKKDKEKFLGLKREEIIVIFAHSPLFFLKERENNVYFIKWSDKEMKNNAQSFKSFLSTRKSKKLFK